MFNSLARILRAIIIIAMKNVLFLILALIFSRGVFARDDGDTRQKLLYSFKQNFPRAENVSWEENQGLCTVSFIEGSIRSSMTWLKNGVLVRSVRYYKEHDLPFPVRVLAKKEFSTMKIYGATEIS